VKTLISSPTSLLEERGGILVLKKLTGINKPGPSLSGEGFRVR
jgi:hypothetical protein